jgi:hypothetical protein
MPFRIAALTSLALASAATPLCGQEPMLTSVTASPAPATPNVPLPTFGGQQFWSDEFVYRDWRIQRHALTDHCRLLDPRDVRRAWGTYDQCRAAFDALKGREMLPPLEGRAVITLHGLIRSRDHMAGLGRYLAEQGGWQWINVSYASTRRSLDEHALSLARVLDGLEGIDEIDFVCHSLGNLVVRRYLGEANCDQPRWQPDARIRRMVMLGPPNNGAQFAELFKQNELFSLVTGPSGKQLARDFSQTQKLLATPGFPFAILAGGRGDGRGANPLLEGDDDWIVSVEETRLAGARDFRLVNCLHGRMMDDPTVQQYVLAFLRHGCFTTEQERQPIPAAQPAARDQASGP